MLKNTRSSNKNKKIMDPPPDLDLNQNWIVFSLTHISSFNQVSWKSHWLFLTIGKNQPTQNKQT